MSTTLFACTQDKQTPQKLDPITKAYFDFKDGSIYVYTDYSDTNVSMVYTSQGYINTQSNPDIENNEIMTYDWVSTGKPTYTIRCESGGAQFKDRIALITKFNDSIVIGPISFNVGGVFSSGVNSFDSIHQYPTYTIKNQTFNDVVRITPYQNTRYKEIWYAKDIGLVARRETNGKLYFLKRWRLNK